jgi:hypothetical protein
MNLTMILELVWSDRKQRFRQIRDTRRSLRNPLLADSRFVRAIGRPSTTKSGRDRVRCLAFESEAHRVVNGTPADGHLGERQLAAHHLLNTRLSLHGDSEACGRLMARPRERRRGGSRLGRHAAGARVKEVRLARRTLFYRLPSYRTSGTPQKPRTPAHPHVSTFFGRTRRQRLMAAKRRTGVEATCSYGAERWPDTNTSQLLQPVSARHEFLPASARILHPVRSRTRAGRRPRTPTPTRWRWSTQAQAACYLIEDDQQQPLARLAEITRCSRDCYPVRAGPIRRHRTSRHNEP